MYHKWYYEAIIDHVESVTHLPPHIRIGWANTEGYIPYPGGGEHWGCNGVGDDLFSYGFDGVSIWTGRFSVTSYSNNTRMIKKSITNDMIQNIPILPLGIHTFKCKEKLTVIKGPINIYFPWYIVDIFTQVESHAEYDLQMLISRKATSSAFN